MTETNPATVAERLAAAGLRVKPLVWRKLRIRFWVGVDTEGHEWAACSKRHRATCEADHAAAVLAMLEPIQSEEPQP